MGWLTLEELLWDDQGRLTTAGASTYKLPSWSEMPEDFPRRLSPGREARVGDSWQQGGRRAAVDARDLRARSPPRRRRRVWGRRRRGLRQSRPRRNACSSPCAACAPSAVRCDEQRPALSSRVLSHNHQSISRRRRSPRFTTMAECLSGTVVSLRAGRSRRFVRADTDATVIDRRGGVLLPGFVDTHVTYPQLRIIGRLGRSLLDWLEHTALPEEARMSDAVYASDTAVRFVRALAAHGTTTALVFGAHFAAATASLFDAAARAGLRIISGTRAVGSVRSPLPASDRRERVS